jgi:EAL domain-containing protein (putative c-di-GMP-specific phosphodiesterase class I)
MSGKNGYKFYSENFSKELQRQINIEQELSSAIDNDELYVVYQPKYSLKSKKILGLEALLRWNSKKLGNIPPDIFIPIAENIGIMYDIGLFVLSRSCKDYKMLKERLPDLINISVNVSVVQLNNPNILEDFLEIMEEEKITPKDMAIEITETALMRNIENNIKILKSIKKSGLQICLDDFGTGYSSLNYLIRLPIDNIKIDKSFIDLMFKGDKERGMIKTIKSISDNFGYHTVAEGIESEEQEIALSIIGINYGQGYHFCKPLTKEELIKRFGATFLE